MSQILDFEEYKTKHANRNKLHIHYRTKTAIREDDTDTVFSSVGVTSLGDDPELVIIVNQLEGGRLDTLTFTPNEIPYLMDALQEAYDYISGEE